MRRGDFRIALLISTAVHAAVLVQALGVRSVANASELGTATTEPAVALLARPTSPAKSEPLAKMTPATLPARAAAEAPVPAQRLPSVSSLPPAELPKPAPDAPVSTAALAEPERQRDSESSAAAQPLQQATSSQSNPIRAVYPWRARKLGQEGRVLVQVSYDALGRLVDLQLARSSGYPLLDREALGAVRRSSPRSSRAIEEIEVIFELQDSTRD